MQGTELINSLGRERSQNVSPEELYGQYVKPKVKKILKLLRLNQIYTRAMGDALFFLENGRENLVYDFLGGYGSTILGHNNSEIIADLKESYGRALPFHAQASVRNYTALLAKKINDVIAAEWGAPKHYYVTLANSGAEAVEAAIKHALMEWQARRKKFILGLESYRGRLLFAPPGPVTTGDVEALISKIEGMNPVFLALEGSFHGKTAGAVATTSNTDFSCMYAHPALDVEFIKRNATARDLESALARREIRTAAELPPFSSVAGIIFEPIQCEGGIEFLSSELLAALKNSAPGRQIPIIADEIQSGFYRTGRFLASTEMGLRPDYILLGKSLGGGLAKISACLIAREHYRPDFGILHTSTFAEDDVSSKVALKALELTQRDRSRIADKAQSFERIFKEGLTEIQKKYPGVITEVRGRGFLLGVQFNFSEKSQFPIFLKWIFESGYATYVFTSYLLHRYGVRVGVTLSRPDTLRIEPAWCVTEQACAKLLAGLEDLASVLSENRILHLTAHLWKSLPADADLTVKSKPHTKPSLKTEGLHKVAFLTHLINTDTLNNVDQLFERLPRSERQRFHQKFGPFENGYMYHEQIVEGLGNRKVHLRLYGLLVGSDYFTDALREKSAEAFLKVERLLKMAEADNMVHVGLGQYTSIISENGLLLRKTQARLTTGNSLTAGLAYKGLIKLCKESGIDLKQATVGVVGVTGNICNILTQIIADGTDRLVLFGRESIDTSPKFQGALAEVMKNSSIKREQVTTSCDLRDLTSCDVVIAGTNSAEAIIFPEHLKKDALVLDISVPSNIAPSVRLQRPDVKTFQGGFAKTPFRQNLETPLVPCPPGEVFACLAETLTVAMTDYPAHFSFGPLTKTKVKQAMAMAKTVGFELGSLKREALF